MGGGHNAAGGTGAEVGADVCTDTGAAAPEATESLGRGAEAAAVSRRSCFICCSISCIPCAREAISVDCSFRRASKLSTRPESRGGAGAVTEVEGAVLGAVIADGAAAGARGGSTANIGVPGPNGRRRAWKSLNGMYGSRPLLD